MHHLVNPEGLFTKNIINSTENLGQSGSDINCLLESTCCKSQALCLILPRDIRMPELHNVGRVDGDIGVNVGCVDPFTGEVFWQ